MSDRFPGYALATDEVARQRQPVRYMYRVPVEDPRDSGWRFFTGTEHREAVADPSRIGTYELETIVEIDPTIAPLLDRPAPCAFERGDPTEPFRAADFAD